MWLKLRQRNSQIIWREIQTWSDCEASGCQFIRAENYVFSHVADEGLMAEASAGPLLRFRRSIGAQHVAVLADVKKKHSAHALTADVDVVETVRAATFFQADGVVITGSGTGFAADSLELRKIKACRGISILAGCFPGSCNLVYVGIHRGFPPT